PFSGGRFQTSMSTIMPGRGRSTDSPLKTARKPGGGGSATGNGSRSMTGSGTSGSSARNDGSFFLFGGGAGGLLSRRRVPGAAGEQDRNEFGIADNALPAIEIAAVDCGPQRLIMVDVDIGTAQKQERRRVRAIVACRLAQRVLVPRMEIGMEFIDDVSEDFK